MTRMTYRNLGDSDLVVSSVGLGCNNFGRPGAVSEAREGTEAVISTAIDEGVTLFDTADIYGTPAGTSETLMGEVLGNRRDTVVLATKFGNPKASAGPESETWGPKGARNYVRRACEASLGRLQTDRIDLYQMHSPDASTPIAETLDALGDLITEGKVRYIGHSNFNADQIAEADRLATEHGGPRFISAQNEYSLLRRGVEHDVLPAVIKYRLGFLPYYPLFIGLLTGQYTRSGSSDRRHTPELLEGVDWGKLASYQSICDELAVPMTHVTFAWLLAQPGMGSVIAGATTREQVVENAAATRVELPPEAVQRISDLFT